MNKKKISLFEIVGSGLCVSSADGQKVHDRLAPALREGVGVSLSFLNVSTLTSAFLNAAIGQLYGEFSEAEIKQFLSVQDIAPDDAALLKRVVDTAKQYFADPKRFDSAVKTARGDDDDDA
jgi:hypothetical protein